MSDYAAIAAQLRDEAIRAAAKHAPMHSHHEAKAVIEEEFDEYWDLVKLNPRKPMTHPTKGHPMTPDQWRQELRDELVQMGAMCVRALHDLCEEKGGDVCEPVGSINASVSSVMHPLSTPAQSLDRIADAVQPRQACVLNLDSPSFPPETDEYRQCGCVSCRKEYTRRGGTESYSPVAVQPPVNLRTGIKGICGSTRPEIGDCVRPAGHQGSHRDYNGNLWEGQ